MKLLLTGKNGQVGFELQRALAVLAEEARALGALLVRYSTDYVFDGTKDGAYLATDAPNPTSQFKIGHAIAAHHLRPAPARLEGRCRPYPGPDSLTP